MSTFLGTKYSEQNILNESFDKDFGVLAVELLGYDPITDSIKRVTIDALNHYATNDVDNNNKKNVYEGLETSDGSWQIVNIVTTGKIISNRYATITNNPTYTSYASAFTDRATLTYDYYSVAF
jgi:hypothetical protein